MVSGNWLDPDGRFRQYGTSKATPEVGGDYLAYGETRCIELTIDLTTLTTSPKVQSYTTFFPNSTQIFVEKVVVDVETASAGGTSFSVGTGYLTSSNTPPVATAISNTAFVNALVNASTNAAGDQVSMTAGSTSAGGYIGGASGDQTHKNYITALASGTYTAGLVKVRIYYRGVGTITQ
jgi:hypothetical protein